MQPRQKKIRKKTKERKRKWSFHGISYDPNTQMDKKNSNLNGTMQNVLHKFCNVPLKFAFFFKVCMFGSCFRTPAVYHCSEFKKKKKKKKSIMTWNHDVSDIQRPDELPISSEKPCTIRVLCFVLINGVLLNLLRVWI